MPPQPHPGGGPPLGVSDRHVWYGSASLASADHLRQCTILLPPTRQEGKTPAMKLGLAKDRSRWKTSSSSPDALGAPKGKAARGCRSAGAYRDQLAINTLSHRLGPWAAVWSALPAQRGTTVSAVARRCW